ncbi:UDP-glucose 4-epimerase family protein [Desulfonatronum thioautotrophicum]|uniref:UDP-glucose 4-epimerase family protein n=1 Tax=Desulfonatronum thioautotrophicum TaxID=617001 RepID=UPI00069B2A4B|nr:SDR family oxidoreductase [Desulfonatronum thioautotrophicum]
MTEMRILVTGANGFVGRALCPVLRSRGHKVRAALRTRSVLDDDMSLEAKGEGGVESVEVGDIDGQTDWSAALDGIQVVVHLAGRAHQIQDRAKALSTYRVVNLDGTENLARQAAKHGVRRVVFVSSIKVNGEETHDKPFTEADPPKPEDPYGISKWEAEQVLAEASAATGLEVTVLRPPLVHGPGAKGNLLRLMDGIRLGKTFPLGAVDNARSMLGIHNLCDALERCVTKEATGTFLAADAETISSRDLVRELAEGMGRKAKLFSVPVAWMEIAAKVAGRQSEFRRLTGSLEVDAGKIQRELGWVPAKGLHDGLMEMARWYATANLK